MKITGMGLDLSGNPLFQPVDEDRFADALVSALKRNSEPVQKLSMTTSQGVSFKGEVERTTPNPGNPREAGWSFLISSTDPQRIEIQDIIKPLALHRAMKDPESPLLYNCESPDEWLDWLNDNYYALQLKGKQVPQYVLIVGSPEQIPFHFQSVLNTSAKVGRIDLDSLDDLKNYVDKIIRIEKTADPLVTREVILFAPDAGPEDPTYFSQKYMAKPLAEHIQDQLGLSSYTMLGPDATKKNLLASLLAKKPALIYTASHGLGAINDSFEIQKQYNGAICCQHLGQLNLDALFSAKDVPFDQPFLEGAVFFQFACFGYGTPAESDYAHWLDGVPKKYTDRDFVAALPKRLLAHPRGPIAFIGHLDTAFLHSFADPREPNILERWHTRIAPFVRAVDELLGVQPSGLAMQDMNHKYSACNALITNTYDRERRGKLMWTRELKASFLDNWITRSDAQNYMIFGDPGVSLRIPLE